MNWYVGTDWSVIPAGGNSLRQVFVRLEDWEAIQAELALEKQLRADVTLSNVTFIKQIRRVQASEEEQKARNRELEAIIARNDTTESFKCTECGAWHVRKVEAK